MIFFNNIILIENCRNKCGLKTIANIGACQPLEMTGWKKVALIILIWLREALQFGLEF